VHAVHKCIDYKVSYKQRRGIKGGLRGPISPRHESREVVGAVAVEGRSGTGAERSRAAPWRGGGIVRWRDERGCSVPWDCSARVPRRWQAVKKTGEEGRELLRLGEAST
jgi:hypothetical protein